MLEVLTNHVRFGGSVTPNRLAAPPTPRLSVHTVDMTPPVRSVTPNVVAFGRRNTIPINSRILPMPAVTSGLPKQPLLGVIERADLPTLRGTKNKFFVKSPDQLRDSARAKSKFGVYWANRDMQRHLNATPGDVTTKRNDASLENILYGNSSSAVSPAPRTPDLLQISGKGTNPSTAPGLKRTTILGG